MAPPCHHPVWSSTKNQGGENIHPGMSYSTLPQFWGVSKPGCHWKMLPPPQGSGVFIQSLFDHQCHLKIRSDFFKAIYLGWVCDIFRLDLPSSVHALKIKCFRNWQPWAVSWPGIPVYIKWNSYIPKNMYCIPDYRYKYIYILYIYVLEEKKKRHWLKFWLIDKNIILKHSLSLSLGLGSLPSPLLKGDI